VDERVQRLMLDGYAAVNRGDIDAAVAAMDPAIELRSSGAFLDEGEVYQGREGVRRFYEMIAEAFDELTYELIDMRELEDGRVFVQVLFRGRGKGSGVAADLDGAHIWTLRDYRAVRLDAYSDLEKARAAAGLT
jgi:ketosteroid isomerase-like protein